MKKLMVIAVVMLAVCLSLKAAAVPGVVQVGHFDCAFDASGGFSGGGDGYIWPGGVWQYYDQGPGDPWWNQWWCNDPFQWTGKDVRLQFDYAGSGWFSVTINWSTPEWSVLGLDRPPNPDEEWAIERLEGQYGRLWPANLGSGGGGQFSTIWFSLPIDYNPEWVSVDIRWDYGPVEITNGTLEHVCLVPEPSSMALIGIGLLALMKRK